MSVAFETFKTYTKELEDVREWVHVISDAQDVMAEFEVGEAFCKTIAHVVDHEYVAACKKLAKTDFHVEKALEGLQKAYIHAHILFDRVTNNSVRHEGNAVKIWMCKRKCDKALEAIEACVS